MSDKPKTPNRRGNRYKKSQARPGPGMLVRLLWVVKVSGLLVLLLAVSALFMLGYAAVTQSEYFQTRAIMIQGLTHLSHEAVTAQAGLKPGDNLLAINLHLVRKRLLGHPWIADARVSREIPETLDIRVVEHVPLAVVDLGRRFLMNTEGRIFKELEPDDPQALVVVKGIRYTDISLGKDPLSPTMQTVMQVLALSRDAKAAFRYDRIARLDWDPELGVTLIGHADQRAYRLGFASFEVKFNRLAQLIRQLDQNEQWCGYQSVDVNNPDRIVVQLGSGQISKRGA